MNFSLWRRRREENLEEEIQSHLKMAIQERMERGESAEQAQYSARREFGNVGLVKEVARDMWGWTSLERLAQDLRYALRALRKSPGFTSVAVLCLALGIGANTTVFSLIEATLLRMLPVKEPERLVLVENSQGQRPRSSSFSYPHFAYMREHSNLTDIFAYSHISLNLSAGALTDSPSGQLVSDNYFSVLGVRPALGRGFVPGDGAVAVISYRFWKSRFRGDPGIVGRSVSLNGVPFTLVGVTPQRFFGIEAGTSPDIFVPLLMCDRLEQGKPRLPMPNRFWLGVMGRLQAGVSMEQAGAEANVIYQQATTELARALPPNKLVRYLRGMRITLAPGNKGTASLRKQFGKPLLILMTVVALVLLIACANVASLLLARAANRQREMAIRAALGAGRTRLLRQVLTESIVLSLAGGLLGLLFAFWGTETLVKLLARNMLDASPDIRVLGFTLAVSMLTGLLFGAVPGLQATRSNLTSALKEEPASRAPRRRFGLRNLLVVGQVAVSLFLLIGAGLFIRTLANLKYLDTGFHADNVLLVSLNPGLSRYSPERTRSFYDQLLERVAGLPGVHSASMASEPLLGGTYIDGLVVEGQAARPGESTAVRIKSVSAGFFETMGIALRVGRDFSSHDRSGARVAIINEVLARQFFSGQNPIGKLVGVGSLAPDREIVGVIADTKYRNIREPFSATVYLLIGQGESAEAERTLHVRTGSDAAAMAAAVREQVRALDKELPVAKVNMFSDLVDENLVQERLIATLSGFFGALALLLASIGLYGVMAYSVQRRTREIGIRMSLGAARGKVAWMILRDCLLMVTAGIAIGIPLSLYFSKLVSSQLFGLSPDDPVTIAAATLLLIAVAAVAGSLPARRATRVDPMVALRCE